MEIFKEMCGTSGCSASGSDLELINGFSKSALTAEQVYTFCVRLCDNEIDRDGERFSAEALTTLAELFVGKTGIFDHNWTAEGQKARIYKAEVITENTITTEAGDAYRYLRGSAYMLRSDENRELIAEIEAGIKKEVSVGCSVKHSVCSVCGGDYGTCEHEKGQTYGGKLCFAELREPVDAYEWSFVAVPAQRKAGVLKKFGRNNEKKELEKLLKENGSESCREEYEKLKRQAQLGKSYIEGLRSDLIKLALTSDDAIDCEIYKGIADKLDEKELVELRRVYQRRADAMFPVQTQLAEKPRDSAREEKSSFLI